MVTRKKYERAYGNIGYIKNRKVSDVEVLREDWIEEKFDASDLENTDKILFVTNEKLNITNISTAFATYAQRNQIIQTIYNEVMQNQYKGVCIDLEQIDDVNSFYRFLIELSPKFKESGLKVGVKENSLIDQEKVKNMVDFIME